MRWNTPLTLRSRTAIPRGVVVLVDRRTPRRARVVHEDVQLVLAAADLIGEPAALGFGREVGRDPDALPQLGERSLGLGDGVRLAGRDVDLRAGAHVRLGDHQPDPTGAARDEGDLSANREQLLEDVISRHRRRLHHRSKSRQFSGRSPVACGQWTTSGEASSPATSPTSSGGCSPSTGTSSPGSTRSV